MTGMLDSLINLKLLLEGIFLLADYKYINHERYNAREMLCLGGTFRMPVRRTGFQLVQCKDLIISKHMISLSISMHNYSKYYHEAARNEAQTGV